ncbi:hypothetical protein DFA_04320 [Cavenderia fasciculata]|uniref:Countin-like protein n=1 Tax=Cavenderia fasciculata TaxID=261658 RepID=F4PP89_CACFS|nr:uncharacterized protein DFA_04320 [Cavenderia fasciculata]EGG22202.1 hypothetical protein DFA_04320 [Cavenderia fasciculata]|eukprot:XP_004360053.1 hypothetical protein DFA_04320 [Cavenderia fasciculata]
MFKQIIVATIFLVAFSAVIAQCNPVVRLAVEEEEQDVVPSCSSCYVSMDSSIAVLNQILRNNNNFEYCLDLCDQLSNNNRVSCNLTCESLGYSQFVYFIGQDNADPIALCQYAGICPANSNPSGDVRILTVTPAYAPIGTPFNISMSFNGLVQAGQAQVIVNSPLQSPIIISNQLLVNFNATSSITFIMNTSAATMSGIYQITGLICADSCESNDINAKVLDKATASFSVYLQ